MSLLHALLMLGTGIIAGFINMIAGGGSFLTLPALIFLGLPPAVANGTNRIAIIVQGIVGIINFRNKGFFYPKIGFLLGIPAILGSIFGAKVALLVSDELFEKILAVTMFLALILVITRPEKIFIKEIDSENPGIIRPILAMLTFFGIGFYGGFISAGVGFFIIVSLTLITGMSLVKVNCLKVFIVFILTIFSLPVFLLNGKVDIKIGLILAIGYAIGAYLGSSFAVIKGDRWIRIILIITMLAIAAKLIGLFELIGL